MASPIAEPEKHPVSSPDESSRDGKREPHDPLDSTEASESTTDPDVEYPSILVRSVVVSSLLLATFLVGSFLGV